MKKIYLSILAMCLAVTALAQQRTNEELHTIAASQLLSAGVKAQVGGQKTAVQDIHEIALTENVAIYGSDEAGFVVMARDSRLRPILGVSLNSYTPGNEPDGFKWWLAEQEKALASSTARMNIGAKAPEIIDETIDEEEESLYTPVSNFVRTRWGQNEPYNLQCPKISGTPTLTGCVATAMAQILRYNQYPTHSTGKAKYTTSQTQTAITVMLNTTFDYSIMVNDYSYGKRSDEAKNAVALLMRDCGYATFMNYGIGGSGASDIDAAIGLTKNLGYDTLAVTLLFQDFYTSEEWMDIINEEIQAKRAILYCANDARIGGHAFLFSGIDAQGKLYVNWGWNGSSDGYFLFNNLTPTNILGTSATYNFNANQSMIIGFTPDGQPLEDAEPVDHLGLIGQLKLSSTMPDVLSVDFPGMYNFHYLTFYGEIYITFENIDNPDYSTYMQLYSSAEDGGAIDAGYGFKDFQFDVPVQSLGPGRYNVNIVSNYVGSDYFYYVRSMGGIYTAHFTKDADGVITASESTLYDGVTDVTTDPAVTTTDKHSTYTGRWYDLTGRQVENPAKGLYIINGQKVLMK